VITKHEHRLTRKHPPQRGFGTLLPNPIRHRKAFKYSSLKNMQAAHCHLIPPRVSHGKIPGRDHRSLRIFSHEPAGLFHLPDILILQISKPSCDLPPLRAWRRPSRPVLIFFQNVGLTPCRFCPFSPARRVGNVVAVYHFHEKEPSSQVQSGRVR
jgi:hypothetical protein